MKFTSLLFLAALFVLTQSAEPQNTTITYLTSHFNDWLIENGYEGFNFSRRDVRGGSFGGKENEADTVIRKPIIFFHANSDRAFGRKGEYFSGFHDTITYFLNKGYKRSELYATTWGPANYTFYYDQYHSFNTLYYLRNFVEAVLEYTGASKIDVISHSMGVTLARKVIKGGTGMDLEAFNSYKIHYDLGPSLAPYVDIFIGIAGANYGLLDCLEDTRKNCGRDSGFFPGYGDELALASFLEDLNTQGGKEGKRVVSIYSTADEFIDYNGLVEEKYTSQIPTADRNVVYSNYTHMELKNCTVAKQYSIITTRNI